MQNNLPPNLPVLKAGWSWVKLGDIGKVVSGGTPSTKVEEYFDGNISWLTPADLTGYPHKFISRGRRNISEKGLKSSSAKLIPKGSILFSSRAPIGYVVIAQNDISTNQGFKNLIPKQNVFNEYVYYYLKASKQLAESNASGTTFKEISAKSFANLPIPLPPLPEQRRIVEKIEELFSELDNGIDNLKKAKAQIKTYRQAVLKFAFEGKLVQGEGKKAKGKSENGELPDGWEFVNLDDAAAINMGQSPPGTSYNKEGEGMPLINGPVEFGPLPLSKTIMSKFTTKPTKICDEHDLILCVRGSTTGRTNIAGFKACIGRGVAAIKAKYNQGYLNYFILFKRQFIYDLGTGSTFPSVSASQIKSICFPLAPINQQTQIVEEIERRFSVADKMEAAIEESLKKSEALRQSILKQAFEGKL